MHDRESGVIIHVRIWLILQGRVPGRQKEISDSRNSRPAVKVRDPPWAAESVTGRESYARIPIPTV